MHEVEQLQSDWDAVVRRVSGEYAALPAAERAWIAPRLLEAARLQRTLQAAFVAAGGDRLCVVCTDSCCDRGLHHFTLANLLAWLATDEAPPRPDFAAACPWLGAVGCVLAAERRPYNCITFACAAVEARMDAGQRERFAAAERQLRAIYLDFDRRYAGSSLRGLLLRATRLGDTPFFARPAVPAAGASLPAGA